MSDETEIEQLRAEVARLRIEPDNVERLLGIDPNDPLEKLAAEIVRLRATVARFSALTDEVDQMAHQQSYEVAGVLWDIVGRFRAVLADAPAERLHGPGCVDCDSGVTEFHRSRTDKPNNLRAPTEQRDTQCGAKHPDYPGGGERCTWEPDHVGNHWNSFVGEWPAEQRVEGGW
jgi:hypothetical protein